MTPTAARPFDRKSAHYYSRIGVPVFELIGKTTGEPRAVTIKDCRELDLLPSPTTILRLLGKPGLENWKIEQAILAAVTTPRRDGEGLDDFIKRVVQVEEVHEQEAQIARDRGREIHAAICAFLNSEPVSDSIMPWIKPAMEAIEEFGEPILTETVLIGNGYAGTADSVFQYENGDHWILDWKGAKTIPDKPYPEHRLQLASYAAAYCRMNPKANRARVHTANVYISSTEIGKHEVHEHADWITDYHAGFSPVFTYWKWLNRYEP